MDENVIGKVEKFFQKPSVAAVRVENGALKVGDKVRFHGATTDFTQTVDSMQIEHDAVETAAVGQVIGMRVKEHAREHDEVFKVIP